MRREGVLPLPPGKRRRFPRPTGGVDPRPYAAFVVTGAVIVRADRVVRPYKMFDEPDAASPRRTFFPPDGIKRDALRPAPHMGNIY